MANKETQKLKSSTDILKRGGKLLKESCSQCGGLLLQYQGRTFCINCDDISEIDKITISSTMDTTLLLKNLISKKIEETSKYLESEKDIANQTHLAELLLKYIEILNNVQKTEKIVENKKDK